MGWMMRAAAPVPGRARSANDRWKDRWTTWVVRSTIIGAMVHALIFALWPLWDVTYVPPPRQAEMVQITPIISAGDLSSPEQMALAAVPDEPAEEEIRRDEGGAGSEDLEVFATAEDLYGLLPDPTLAYPTLPTGVYGRPAPPLESEVILDRLTAITPRVVAMERVDWPKIRNPTMIVRYLRREFGRMRGDPMANGFVSVSMLVDEQGRVEWAQVSRSSGHSGLDNLALAVFSDIVIFTPARREGDPIPLGIEITIPFTMPW